MTAGVLALLAGMFGVPGLLLWLGHGLRRRPPAWRRAFWGAVLGHTLGVLLTLAAVLYPPVHWEGDGWRDAAVHGSMLLGAVLGGAAGAAGARRPGSPRP